VDGIWLCEITDVRGPASRASYAGVKAGSYGAAPLALFDGHRRGRHASADDYPPSSSGSSGEDERTSRRRPPPPRRAPRAPPRAPPRRAPAPKKRSQPPTSAALVPYAPARTGRRPDLGDEIEVEVECEGVTTLEWRKAQARTPSGLTNSGY
jgi:hypothetical protein